MIENTRNAVSVSRKSRKASVFMNVLFVAAIAFPASCFAANPEWLYFSGQSYVYAIKNSGDFLWIGTDGGLARLNKKSEEITHFTTASGIKNNRIKAVAIDNDQKIWLGTDFGIACFDGKDWRSYSPLNVPQMPTRYFSALAADERNRMWGGTWGVSYLSIYDGKKWLFSDLLDSTPVHKSVNCIVHGWKGKTVFGVSWGQIGYADDSTFVFDSGVVQNTYCLAVDKDTNLWIATKSGLARYDGSQVKIFDTDNSKIPSNEVYCCKYAENGSIIAGTLNGLGIYDGNDWRRFDTANSDIPENYISAVECDETNTVWVGTWKRGIAKFNGTAWKRYDIRSAPIIQYFPTFFLGIDRYGRGWLNGYHEIYCFDGKTWTTYDTTAFAALDTVFTRIYTGPTHIAWADSHCAVVYYRYSHTTSNIGSHWELYALKNPRHGSRFKRDGYGNYWHGTDYGLWKYSQNGSQLFDTTNSELPLNTVHAVAIDTMNRLWLSLEEKPVNAPFGMLACFSQSGKCSTVVTCDEDYWISHIEIDTKDGIWYSMPDKCHAGDPFGKGVFRIAGGTTVNYTSQNSGLTSNTVFHMFFDAATGVLWIGAFGEGFCTVDGSLQWNKNLKENTRLANSCVNRVEIDSMGNKWILCNGEGLTIYREGGIVFQKQAAIAAGKKKNPPHGIFKRSIDGNACFYFNATGPSDIEVTLYSCAGRTVRSFCRRYDAGANAMKVDLHGLQSGYYILKIKGDNRLYSNSFVVMK